MSHKSWFLCFSLTWLLWQPATAGLGAAETALAWDCYSDTWPATDALGRQLPNFAEAGPVRSDRFVGIFYFLWLEGQPGQKIYDVTKIKAANPVQPQWGPFYAQHHWAESRFGYYQTDDPFVLRRHAQLLADAGVDTLIFDVTNQLTYKAKYLALLRVFQDVRDRGGKTPQVLFLCPFHRPAKVVTELWEDLYQPNLHPDLWFRWKGKPLILADPAQLPGPDEKFKDHPAWPRLRPFFTFRKPQPDYFRGPTQADMWSWLEVFPQHMFTNASGENEQMSVGVAQNAVRGRLGSMSEPGVCGRSFRQGKPGQKPEDILWGHNLAEQFGHALKQDPQFIFITGWNEWIAGRYPEFNGVRGDMFPDEFDEEGSRDIEPMKGGHGDNYYYQMVSYIRRYKGVRPPPAASPRQRIRLEGDFKQWAGVQPEFRDDLGDTAHRDFAGFNNCCRYTNNSGRNDFVALKVARDARNIYFYARTRSPITPCTGRGWMMLLIDADQAHSTGWEGYDFILNRVKAESGSSVLERNVGGWNWRPVDRVRFVVKGNELHLALARTALGMTPERGPLRFDFKWADNVPESGDILDFIDQGDVAPNGRFNYRYGAQR